MALAESLRAIGLKAFPLVTAPKSGAPGYLSLSDTYRHGGPIELGRAATPHRRTSPPPRHTPNANADVIGVAGGFDPDIDHPASREIKTPCETFTNPQNQRPDRHISRREHADKRTTAMGDRSHREHRHILPRPAETRRRHLAQRRQRRDGRDLDHAHNQRTHTPNHQPKTQHTNTMSPPSTSPDLSRSPYTGVLDRLVEAIGYAYRSLLSAIAGHPWSEARKWGCYDHSCGSRDRLCADRLCRP
jgi:hypothetical protein